MSRLRKAVGYVLRTQDYSETSKIVKALTREAGLISLLAKGARRPTSPFGAALEPLTLSEFVYYDREGLKTLSQASLLEPHLELKRDYDKLTTALRCARVVHRALEEDHPEERVFRLFEELLEALGRATATGTGTAMGTRAEEEGWALYELAFTLQLLARLGWAPQLERCTGCQEAPRRAWFSPERGGLICERCRSSAEAPAPASGSSGAGSAIPLDGEAMRGLAMALRLPLRKLSRLRLSAEALAVGERLLEGFLAHHVRPLGARPRPRPRPRPQPQRCSK